MGVNGLLPSLKSITHPAPLDRYRGLTVAVDAMSWLHKGLFACDVRALAKEQWKIEQVHDANENEKRDEDDQVRTLPEKQDIIKKLNFDNFAEEENEVKNVKHMVTEDLDPLQKKYILYTIRHAEILQKQYSMQVILVIDGAPLPSKDEINRKRYIERSDAFKEALHAEIKGEKTSRTIRQLYAKSCSITYEMRYELVQACRKLGVSFLVAPYEADAQMAFMAHNGIVDLVITEDSDLLAYGCPRVLFKIDFDEGNGEEIQLMRYLGQNEGLSFRNWTHDMFVYMCILSGCDYFEGAKGMGIKGAHKIVRIHRSPTKIFLALTRMGKNVDSTFEEMFWKAFRTFRYQRVYCAEKNQIQTLFEPEEYWKSLNVNFNSKWDYLGSYISPEVAAGISNGDLHPVQRVPWVAIMTMKRENEKKKCNKNVFDTCQKQKRKEQNLDMFSFFSSKKNKTTEAERNRMERPPLLQISMGNNFKTLQRLKGKRPRGKNRKKNSIAHQGNVDKYTSKLVGSDFRTIRRHNCNAVKQCIKSNMIRIMDKAMIRKRPRKDLNISIVKFDSNKKEQSSSQQNFIPNEVILENNQGLLNFQNKHFIRQSTLECEEPDVTNSGWFLSKTYREENYNGFDEIPINNNQIPDHYIPVEDDVRAGIKIFQKNEEKNSIFSRVHGTGSNQTNEFKLNDRIERKDKVQTMNERWRCDVDSIYNKQKLRAEDSDSQEVEDFDIGSSFGEINSKTYFAREVGNIEFECNNNKMHRDDYSTFIDFKESDIQNLGNHKSSEGLSEFTKINHQVGIRKDRNHDKSENQDLIPGNPHPGPYHNDLQELNLKSESFPNDAEEIDDLSSWQRISEFHFFNN